jgi:hypothetical protein
MMNITPSKSLFTLSLCFLMATISATAHADQMAGVGLESTVATGYGLYAVTMRASASPGAISSFYLYEQSGSYPARWREIDLEFSPGFTGIGSVADPNHPHILAQGQCYSAATPDNLPAKKDCNMQLFLQGTAGSALSFNVYNYRSLDGEPYAHSNDQVFMPARNGNQVFQQFYTYFFYYTPQGIYWTLDLPAMNLTMQPPAELPQPVFVKKDFPIVEKNAVWNPKQNMADQGFWYDAVSLNPKTQDERLAESGAMMNISMNIWDGSNTDPTKKQHWGGPKSPEAGASSSYRTVAFYPLITPVNEVGNDPTKLQYGPAAVFSDFTTAEGKFFVNQKETTFTALWRVSNGEYLWPLGQLDERNIYCGNGELTIKISAPYATKRKNHEKLPNCNWLNIN